MPCTCLKSFTRNGERYYLIPDTYPNKARFLEYLTGKQNRRKEFCNVRFLPYKWQKYPGCIYVVEG